MNEKISNVLYIKVGKVSTTKIENKRSELVSGIKKYPVLKAYLTKTGFKNDEQGDLLHHGGINKALFLFSALTYKKINSFFNDSFEMTDMAYFGENLILSNICEEDICIGDILKIGQTKVQITQPRQPCWKLSANTNEQDMTKIIFDNGLTGWYAKVLEEGFICQNDEVILEKRINPTLNINILNQLIICEVLGKAFFESLSKRYKLKEKDDQFSYYHT